jgi:hypothetical protein
MQHDIIRYAGTYRFARRDVLDRALAHAREHIDEDVEHASLAGGWLRCFILHGTTLTVNLALPAVAELQFAAAEVFATLARAAVDGSVEARIGDRSIDCYVSAEED